MRACWCRARWSSPAPHRVGVGASRCGAPVRRVRRVGLPTSHEDAQDALGCLEHVGVSPSSVFGAVMIRHETSMSYGPELQTSNETLVSQHDAAALLDGGR